MVTWQHHWLPESDIATTSTAVNNEMVQLYVHFYRNTLIQCNNTVQSIRYLISVQFCPKTPERTYVFACVISRKQIRRCIYPKVGV